MSLQEQLDALKAKAKARIPAETLAIMERHVEELLASGIMARVPKVGDRAPDFTLPDADGSPMSLQGLLARGPAVLSFYRGRW
jgi:hypothetical protein